MIARHLWVVRTRSRLSPFLPRAMGPFPPTSGCPSPTLPRAMGPFPPTGGRPSFSLSPHRRYRQRSPGDAGGGGSSFPASWKAGWGPPFPGGGVLRAILVRRVWVTPAAVPSSCGAARLQGLRRLVLGLGAPAPDGLKRAGLYSGQAF
jgi:hypothetical protein